MTKHGVGPTQGEREELLARASRGSGRAAETRRANLLLAVYQGGFADLRTADREAAMACRSTARTARDPKGRLVGEGFDGVLARKAQQLGVEGRPVIVMPGPEGFRADKGCAGAEVTVRPHEGAGLTEVPDRARGGVGRGPVRRLLAANLEAEAPRTGIEAPVAGRNSGERRKL